MQTVRELLPHSDSRTNDLKSQEIQLRKLLERRRDLEEGDPRAGNLDRQIECTEIKLHENLSQHYRERLPGLPEPRIKLLVDAHIKEIKEK